MTAKDFVILSAAIVQVYIDAVHAFPSLDIGLLASIYGGALLLSYQSRGAFIPIESRETALAQVAAFAYSVGLGLARNCKSELN